jgi:hypothetical protein
VAAVEGRRQIMAGRAEIKSGLESDEKINSAARKQRLLAADRDPYAACEYRRALCGRFDILAGLLQFG